jgi:hypothetical protein
MKHEIIIKEELKLGIIILTEMKKKDSGLEMIGFVHFHSEENSKERSF